MSKKTAGGKSSMTADEAAVRPELRKTLGIFNPSITFPNADKSMQGWADVKLPEKPVALRAQLLREAEEITCGDRHMDYGDPVGNHDNIAKIASIATGKDLTAHDVVMVLIAAKIARARISPSKRDHYVDLMAYAGIAYECVMDELRDE